MIDLATSFFLFARLLADGDGDDVIKKIWLTNNLFRLRA